MKVLIAEDDEVKRLQLERFVHENLPDAGIETAKSYHSAVKKVSTASYDLILLDMTMPTYDIGRDEDGGRTQHYAGREILRQLDRRRISAKVIVVTGFAQFGEGSDVLTRPELDKQLRADHPGTYLGAVYYNVASDEWKTELMQIIRKAGA